MSISLNLFDNKDIHISTYLHQSICYLVTIKINLYMYSLGSRCLFYILKFSRIDICLCDLKNMMAILTRIHYHKLSISNTWKLEFKLIFHIIIIFYDLTHKTYTILSIFF